MILDAVVISIKVALAATFFTLCIGIFLARIFSRYNFRGKDVLEVLIMLPMVIPPSVTGYGLLVLLGRRGIIGEMLLKLFGIKLLFTWGAAAVASGVVSLPLMYQSCKAAFLKIDHTYENAARTLGAGEGKVFWRITMPLAWPGVVSGIILSFSRAVGEFGATLMVAGNIPGKTGTIPMTIYFAVESGDRATANILILIVMVFSFTLIYGLNRWIKGRHYTED